MDREASGLLTQLLKDVSRSFYLTMRVLPGPVRSQIGLAYLLARATDTVADTEILPAPRRLEALAGFGACIAGERGARVDFTEFANRQQDSAEAVLLRRAGQAVALLESFDEADQALIRRVLRVIISGQELDLRRFDGANEKNIIALAGEPELDDYTYRVAGVVGEFWTQICRARLFPRARVDETLLMAKGVNFGKGLQLVNILRDIPKDLRQGRCYIPLSLLARAGLSPSDLLDPANNARFRPVYDPLLVRALAFLGDAWDYVNMIPKSQIRVRLGCAWPVLIGLETLAALRSGNVLDSAQRIKVSRKRVSSLMKRSILAYPWSFWWNRLPNRAKG